MSPDALTNAVLGEPEATLFENMYTAYHLDALRLARSLVGDADLAADVVHAAYLEVLRFLLSGRRWFDPDNAKAAVLRHTRWAAHKALRSRHRVVGLDAARDMDDGGEVSQWAQAEARALCEFLVGQLRPDQQAVIRARYLEGLPNTAAATALGITEEAFRTRLSRALAAARRHARGSEMLPALLWIVGTPCRRLRRQPWRRARGAVAGSLGLARVAAVVAAGAAVVMPPAGGPELAPTSAAQPASVRDLNGAGGAPRSPLDDAVVVDAVAATWTGGVTVVALAVDRGCGCWEVTRSQDAGVSWQTDPGRGGPATGAARLLVVPVPGGDDRVFIRGASGTVEMRDLAMPLPLRVSRAFPSRSAVTTLGRSQTGLELPLADSVTLFFPSSGGVICSANGSGC